MAQNQNEKAPRLPVVRYAKGANRTTTAPEWVMYDVKSFSCSADVFDNPTVFLDEYATKIARAGASVIRNSMGLREFPQKRQSLLDNLPDAIRSPFVSGNTVELVFDGNLYTQFESLRYAIEHGRSQLARIPDGPKGTIGVPLQANREKAARAASEMFCALPYFLGIRDRVAWPVEAVNGYSDDIDASDCYLRLWNRGVKSYTLADPGNWPDQLQVET